MTPHIGIFAEPSCLYHLGGDQGIKTWNTEHPFGLSFPIGIRIAF
ncbi:MAG: hypothetical protein ACSW8D_03750 [Prevotella sp.]